MILWFIVADIDVVIIIVVVVAHAVDVVVVVLVCWSGVRCSSCSLSWRCFVNVLEPMLLLIWSWLVVVFVSSISSHFVGVANASVDAGVDAVPLEFLRVGGRVIVKVVLIVAFVVVASLDLGILIVVLLFLLLDLVGLIVLLVFVFLLALFR